MVVIREERPEDIEAVRRLNEEAFGQPVEARIVDSLRENCADILSLVAVVEDSDVKDRDAEGKEIEGRDVVERIVGHILFSPAQIAGERGILEGMGLAPMAILPQWQCRGIGTRLVRTGIEEVKRRGRPFIIVLGHPDYYPRFGFERAASRSIRSQWEGVPEEAFMILVLDEATMQGMHGIARYRKEFEEAA